jgi:hypothetical protein
MKSYRGYRLDGGPGAWKWLPPGNQSGPSPPGDRPPPDRPPPPARPVKPGPFADGDEPVASSSTTGAARTSDPVDGAISAEPTDERPEPPQAPEPPQPPEPPPTLFDIAS